jgi:hypothetical protein
MLRSIYSSPQDVSRYVSARYLNYEPKSTAYKRFRAPLLVSDILEPTVERYRAKVERCLPLTGEERTQALADAETDYALAAEFQKVTAGGGTRSLIALHTKSMPNPNT